MMNEIVRQPLEEQFSASLAACVNPRLKQGRLAIAADFTLA